MTQIQDVEYLYRKFKFPIPKEPKMLEITEMEQRLAFLMEELTETSEAVYNNDIEETIDGLIDLAYVCFGTLVLMGVNTAAHWNEVQRANLEKERIVNGGKRSMRYDLTKPKGWRPPNHKEILE